MALILRSAVAHQTISPGVYKAVGKVYIFFRWKLTWVHIFCQAIQKCVNLKLTFWGNCAWLDLKV